MKNAVFCLFLVIPMLPTPVWAADSVRQPEITQLAVMPPDTADEPARARLRIRGSAEDDVLLGISSLQASAIELHKLVLVHRPGGEDSLVDSLPVPAGQILLLGPGGTDVVLKDYQAPGTGVLVLTFHFEKAGPVTVGARLDNDAMITVSRVRFREPLVAGRPGVAWLTLTGGLQDDRLLSVSSPAAERVEIHDHVFVHGRDEQGHMTPGHMRMVKLDSVDVPKGEQVVFKSGGKHLMLFAYQPLPRFGVLPLTLTFEKLGVMDVEAVLETKPSDQLQHHHH